ncbi:MAG TPA: CBS domain-containing protein [Oceanospirillales bacterium]|nr:CBS domain-containing protein [Oceanospirillales bacterium]
MNEEQSTTSSNQEKKSWLERLSSAFSGDPKNRHDLFEILKEAHENEIIDADALHMIKGAMKVSEMQVRQVMIPRAQMKVIPKEAELEEILSIIVESGHSRFPVVGEGKDEIEGILLAKDLVRYLVDTSIEFKLDDFLRESVVVPESKRVNILLNEFRTSRNHMAIIIDEYGGVAGLVTIEDLLEEIVGEIDDETDEEEDPLIQQLSDNTYKINALLPIEEFNEHFSSKFKKDEFDTIGGMIVNAEGRLPEVGDEINLGNYCFKVLSCDNRRLDQLELTIVK